ncbi:replication-relaxation family protein [Phytohabitans suffuscus]|uniref:replication-relaxation family protein n=1 Tax=Phytohabitans suffuscus TaxID=624315 RepID=UPI00156339E5
MLELIAEHGELYTEQVTEFLFSSRPAASRHLTALTRAGLVRRPVYESDRSHQAHYELTGEGIRALADHLRSTGRPVPVALGSLISDHHIVTPFRVGLTAASREGDRGCLYQWMRALDAVARLRARGISHVNPRAYGVWIEGGVAVKFLPHVDNGEPGPISGTPAPPPSRALAGYRQAGKGVLGTAILVITNMDGRESALLRELAEAPLEVAVAATTTDRLGAASSAADAIWLVAGSATKAPVRLVDVPLH